MADPPNGSTCEKCKLLILRNEKYLECDEFCEKVYHSGCIRISDRKFKTISEIQDEIM